MEQSKLPFYQHFSSIRENPKWGLKFFITLVLSSLTSILSAMSLDYDKMYKAEGMSPTEIEQAKTFSHIIIFISTPIMSAIFIGIVFLIVLAISKSMSSDANVKTILSGTLSYLLISCAVGFVVMLIQWFAGLSPDDYSITSLNIFDKGNMILGIFDLQFLLSAYLFGLMLYATIHLSKKPAIFWTIIYITVSIAITVTVAMFG